MNRIIRGVAAFSLALTLAAPVAMAEESVDAATIEKVTAQLTAEGYEVRKVGREDGYIEVYAVKDGKTYELYLDETLKIVKTNDD
jgi:hypothetical protein